MLCVQSLCRPVGTCTWLCCSQFIICCLFEIWIVLTQHWTNIFMVPWKMMSTLIRFSIVLQCACRGEQTKTCYCRIEMCLRSDWSGVLCLLYHWLGARMHNGGKGKSSAPLIDREGKRQFSWAMEAATGDIKAERHEPFSTQWTRCKRMAL